VRAATEGSDVDLLAENRNLMEMNFVSGAVVYLEFKVAADAATGAGAPEKAGAK